MSSGDPEPRERTCCSWERVGHTGGREERRLRGQRKVRGETRLKLCCEPDTELSVVHAPPHLIGTITHAFHRRGKQRRREPPESERHGANLDLHPSVVLAAALALSHVPAVRPRRNAADCGRMRCVRPNSAYVMIHPLARNSCLVQIHGGRRFPFFRRTSTNRPHTPLGNSVRG